MGIFKKKRIIIKSNRFVAIVAIISLFASIFTFIFVYESHVNKENIFMTGFAIQNYSTNATINLTVSSVIVINFTSNNINFGSGNINLSKNLAVLDTSSGSSINGTWAANSNKLVLQNDGTVNVSLNIMTWKNSTTFIGGTNPFYYYNVTNNESGSCANASGFNLGQNYDVNITYPGTLICNSFGFLDAMDTIKIDFKIGIPYDSNNGTLGDIITATATG